MPTCYRHPARETGVACSSCARPICPDCMTPTPVGMRCPECAKDRTKVRNLASTGGGGESVVTYALMAICVVAFLAGGNFAVGSTSGSSYVFEHGALTAFGIDDGEWWRLVTSGFLHAGIIHIGFNMYLLYLLGPMVEQRIGSVRFGLVYFTALLGGTLGALLQTSGNPLQATVGASGAIFGLMGFVVVTLRNQRGDPMLQQIGILIVLNLVISVAFSANVSLGGHLGGLLFGGLAALAFEVADRVRSGPARAYLAPALCVGLMVVAVVASLSVSAGATDGLVRIG